MDKETEIAWILMAVGDASRHQPADFAAISLAANAINNGAPTHKAMQDAVAWLLEKNLITKQNKRYALSKSGSALLASAQERAVTPSATWNIVEDEVAQLLRS